MLPRRAEKNLSRQALPGFHTSSPNIIGNEALFKTHREQGLDWSASGYLDLWRYMESGEMDKGMGTLFVLHPLSPTSSSGTL